MQPDNSFVKLIRDVLAHIYDYPYLQTHPLAERFKLPERCTPQGRMRFLRSLILEAIEEMNPGLDVPFRSHRARAYNVLNLHYVEGLMIQEVARELAISERQVYRDLRKAEQDLATLLWPRQQVVERSIAMEPTRVEVVVAEARWLRGEREELEMQPLLEGAFQTVTQLSERREVHISLTTPARPVTIRANRMLSRQTLVSVLSHAVQHADPERGVTLSAEWQSRGALLMVSYLSSGNTSEGWEASLTIPRRLVELQRGTWKASTDTEGHRLISFTLGTESVATLLVIDDNEGLIELFRRYLTDEGYRLVGAQNGVEGLRLAQEHSPDVIVLDVMMPQQDGWEVLQLLRNRQRTRDIPVLVCSVIDDPELAFSLGAAEFLAKPVKREDLIRTLARCRR